MFKTFNFYIENKIGYMVLNTPPANTMNRLFFEEICLMTQNYFTENTLKAAIIYSEGRHFSSGADIDDLLNVAQDRALASNFFHKNNKAFHTIYNAPFPVVCLLKGVCIGSAFELALACHFRFATEKTLLGFPEVTFNLMTGCGGSFYLSEIADMKNTLELLLSGKNIETEEAMQLGLIDVILKKDEILQKAVNFVMNIGNDYSKSLKTAYLKNFFKKNNER